MPIMTTTTSSTTPSQRLWAQAEPKALQSLFHPFVAGLAAGRLPREAFQAFLLQDAYYLHSFAKAFAHAVTKCTNSTHTLAIIRLMGGIEEELRTHSAFLESFGVELFQVQETTAAPATRNYVDFLLRTAKRSTSVAEILAAMTPCMRLYAFLGHEIVAAAVGVDSNPYQRWIDTYSAADFQAVAKVSETLLDEVAAEEGVGFETLVPLYNTAMELELRFFEEYFPMARASAESLCVLPSLPLRIQLEVSPDETLMAPFKDIDAIAALRPGRHAITIDKKPTEDDYAITVTKVTTPPLAPDAEGYRRLLAAIVAMALNIPGGNYASKKKAEVVTFLKVVGARHSFAWFSFPPEIHAPLVARVLTIAGSDSGGGAGIQADMKACTNLGVFSTTAITAVTTQNTRGVHGIHPIPVNEIADQVTAVLDDIGTDVVKTGMLFNEEIIEMVATILETRQLPLVVDPVMVATSGHRLLKEAAHQCLVERLFPLATIITPNIPEASAFLHDRVIETVEDMKGAARALAAFGPRFVLIKGGHLKNPPQGHVHDVLLDVDADQFHVIRNKKLATRNTHGTGCTLAAAIAAEFAKSRDMVRAVEAAIAYLHGILHESQELAIGRGESGPMLHVL